MAVVRWTVRAREEYAGGKRWGEAGSYEFVTGVVRFAVDPREAANRSIVDLNLVPAGDDELVDFEADLCIMRPADPARANGGLLCEIPNRGGRGVVPFSILSDEELEESVRRAHLAPSSPAQPLSGDGFLLERGWTIAWCGWQWDVPRHVGMLGLSAPLAAIDPRTGATRTRVGFTPIEDAQHHPLAEVHQNGIVRVPFPVADVHDPTATLVTRDGATGACSVIERGRWRFARLEGQSVVEDDSFIYLDEGFRAGVNYEVVYHAATAPVAGSGLLAVRDAVSFLRRTGDRESGNTGRGRITHTVAYGGSQSGRFLRQFLVDGLNLDEQGRRVFDGIFCHGAGGRLGEFNNRYAQPSAVFTPGFGHLPPFAADDPSGGLLDEQRKIGGVPKVFFVNTSWEYWRGDASLLHIDRLGSSDLEQAPEVRTYLLAGHDHAGYLPRFKETIPAANPHNLLDARPLLRAALDNLVRWVVDGVEPPASRIPRLVDGSALDRRSVLDRFLAFPGVTVPDVGRLPTMRELDLGRDATNGVGSYPAVAGRVFDAFVSAVDGDGNETSGIKLPEVSVPVAAYAGWNTQPGSDASPRLLAEFVGGSIPFARTRAERESAADPRPSVAERYASREAYLELVRAAAGRLVADRFLLPGDLEGVIGRAISAYDRLMTGTGAERSAVCA
jgi:hypothetical protein